MKSNDRGQAALLSIPIDFDLTYLILLTENGAKPLSRWEGILPGGIEKVMGDLGLQYAYVQRRLHNGSSTTEFIFSKSDSLLDLYLHHFDDSYVDKSPVTQRIEGFLFGFPPCCVESFARFGYRPNGLGKEDQKLLFHWACPDCRVTPLLVPSYRAVHRMCSELIANRNGSPSLISKNQRGLAKKTLVAVSLFGLMATGVALSYSVSAHAPAVTDDDPHWLPWPAGTDSDGDFLRDDDEPYLGVQANNPDTDGDGVLDGVQVARAAYALYALLPHEVRSDTPYVVDHMVYGLENCSICGGTVNMGVVEIVNPRENLTIEVPYIALHYLEHGSYQYSGDVHGSNQVSARKLRAVLSGDGTLHRLACSQGDADNDGLYDFDEPYVGTDSTRTDSDGNGICDGTQLARALAAVVDSLPTTPQEKTPYAEHHALRGIATCAECGEVVNMGYVRAINPLENQWTDISYLALHYMRCGGFIYGTASGNAMIDPRVLKTVLESDGTRHLLPIGDDADSDGLTTSEEKEFGTRSDVKDTDGDGCIDGAEISRALAAKVDSLPNTPQSGQPYRTDMMTYGLEECEVCGELINMGYVEVVNPTLCDSLAIPFVGLHAMQHAGLAYDGTVHDGRIDPVRLAAILEFEQSNSVQTAGENIPAACALFPCYPNPFNPKTVVSAQWPVESEVKLVVYDMLGREVTVLANGRYPAGKYTFTFDGTDRATGTYICRLTAGTYSFARTMLLIR